MLIHRSPHQCEHCLAVGTNFGMGAAVVRVRLAPSRSRSWIISVPSLPQDAHPTRRPGEALPAPQRGSASALTTARLLSRGPLPRLTIGSCEPPFISLTSRLPELSIGV
jgi:hypothetical protein